MYQAGDYVYPTDVPQRPLCRIRRAESGRTPKGAFQILTLEALEGPWRALPPTSAVVRFDDDVVPARARDLWRSAATRATVG